MRHPLPFRQRPGFTLIEMLVVITIILTIAGMMVMVSPGITTRQQAASGATQLQGSLLYAKNRAKMNLLPTGILVSQGTPCAVQFIQSAGDFTQGTATVQGNSVTINGAATSLATTVNQGIQPDFFEAAGCGLPHQINGAGPTALALASSPPNGTYPTYRIMRSPRQLYGEQPVELPQNVGCLWSGNGQPGAAFTNGVMQNTFPPYILFAPSGNLTGICAGFDIVCFYVCDVTQPQSFPTIIAIYGKTGFITAHPVNTNPNVGGGSPFYFALNARSSGM